MTRSPPAASRSASACRSPTGWFPRMPASRWRRRRRPAISPRRGAPSAEEAPLRRRPRSREVLTRVSDAERPDPAACSSAAAVRERAHEMLELALDGQGRGLDGRPRPARRRRRADRRGDPRALSRPRHPLPRPLAPFRRRRADAAGRRSAERARAAFDLVILSVLLDAGAGPGWRFADPVSGETFSALRRPRRRQPAHVRGRRPRRSRRARHRDARRGASRSREDNPLVGLDGRAALLRRLGAQVLARPDLFARAAAPGRALRRARRAGRGRPPAGAGDPRAAARSARADLGGPAGRSTACRSAIAGGIRRSAATMPATASCRCTSCRNGWLIR